MNVVMAKYSAIAPRLSYLRDTVILAQAWKKAHTYIRRHNWYADTLELDCSAVDLDTKLADWAAALSDGSYRPAPCRVVPAPGKPGCEVSLFANLFLLAARCRSTDQRNAAVALH